MVSKSEVALVKSEDLKAADAVGVVAAQRNRDQGQALNGCYEKKSQIADDKKSMDGGWASKIGGCFKGGRRLLWVLEEMKKIRVDECVQVFQVQEN